MDETWITISPEEHRAFLAELAKENLRGITSSDIVCDIQRIRSEIDYEKDDMQKYLMECRLNHMLNELERRTRLNQNGIRTTNKEIIQTIKDKILIEDVIAWYTDVYTHRNRWTFRCPLHVDNHPSGVIYLDQQSWWCFQCNQGGDLFDAVQLFERLEFIEAIKKLANFIGLEIKPFEKKSVDYDDRLRQLELRAEHQDKHPIGRDTNNKYIYNNIILEEEETTP